MTKQDLLIEKKRKIILDKMKKDNSKKRNEKYAEILWVYTSFACQLFTGKKTLSERSILILEDYFDKKAKKIQKKVKNIWQQSNKK